MSILQRTQTASQLGCTLDCNLQTGLTFAGGAATDNTAIINAFLATATASSPVRLIMDGGTLSSGIEIPISGHVTIEGLGWDTGFYQKSGANADVINNLGAQNANPFDPGPTAPTITASNVFLRNFFINGNRGNGTTGNSNSGTPQGLNLTPGPWYIGINLLSISNIRIEDVWINDTSAYAIRVGNVSEVFIQGCRITAPSLAYNTDPIHINGPASDIRISNCYMSAGDDTIALNCPEGYSGNISRVLVENCDVVNGRSFMRLYTAIGSIQNTIDTVLICNCTGIINTNSTPAIFYFGNNSGPGVTNAVSSLLVSNCKFTSPQIALVTDNVGFIGLDQVQFIPTGTVVGISVTAGTIATLRIGGFAAPSGTVPYLINVPSGCSLGALLLDSFDSRNFTALVGSAGFTQIVAIGGSAVLESGFAVPNTAMINGSNFLSSTSSLPSVKIAGTVKTYTVS
jgi:hypothetical protein